jgi:hypothetical protein
MPTGPSKEAEKSDGSAPHEPLNKHSFEQMIIRDGYQYVLNCKYKDKLYYKCEDKKNIGCKAVWKLTINES